MPELPEIANLARQMDRALRNKTVARISVLQPRCLNTSRSAFIRALRGARISKVTYHGKWLLVDTTHGWLLLCLGMGGEVLLVTPETLPEKHRLVFDFQDRTSLAINFWWFGYAHYVPSNQLAKHTMTARLGPNILDITESEFIRLLNGRRGQIKAFLLDQSNLAGIGNFYIHDILFRSHLHPFRSIQTLSEVEIRKLYRVIQAQLRKSLSKGGAFYEQDLYGHKGRFSWKDIRIGYREGQRCPICRTPIEKIKTGGTSSVLCPKCQPLP